MAINNDNSKYFFDVLRAGRDRPRICEARFVERKRDDYLIIVPPRCEQAPASRDHETNR